MVELLNSILLLGDLDVEKILISACFLGANVRYNGIVKALEHQLLGQWRKEGRLISVCPEVCGGLTTPRLPAEYQTSSKTIINSDGQDVTQAFEKGAKHALTLCIKHDIKYALLKEYSPSCGSTQIYDGSFSQRKIDGQGMTAALLTKNGIKVYSELSIQELSLAIGA